MRGVLPPAAFLPVAEDAGLLGPLGDWVVVQALGDLGTPVLLLSGSPAEGRLAHGLVPRRLPAGRAQFATRKSGAVLLQTPLPG